MSGHHKYDDGDDPCGRMRDRLHQSLSQWRGSTRTGNTIREGRAIYPARPHPGWPQTVELTFHVLNAEPPNRPPTPAHDPLPPIPR